MNRDDFDAYRANYPLMGSDELANWHSTLFDEHPDQNHYSIKGLLAFFDASAPDDVVEIGGWRGEAAAEVLPKFPDIVSWTNYEICEKAVDRPVCTDKRYRAYHHKVVEPPSCTTLVCSHVIEHLSDAEVLRMLKATDANLLYVDTPLTDGGETWNQTTCFHVLQMGWNDLDVAIRAKGFHLLGQHSKTIRWYER